MEYSFWGELAAMLKWVVNAVWDFVHRFDDPVEISEFFECFRRKRKRDYSLARVFCA